MKLFAREADEVCNKCGAEWDCRSSRAWRTKRRKILKKTGECPAFNAIKSAKTNYLEEKNESNY
jgi:hypothetical protein